jgi:hypothetical protein
MSVLSWVYGILGLIFVCLVFYPPPVRDNSCHLFSYAVMMDHSFSSQIRLFPGLTPEGRCTLSVAVPPFTEYLFSIYIADKREWNGNAIVLHNTTDTFAPLAESYSKSQSVVVLTQNRTLASIMIRRWAKLHYGHVPSLVLHAFDDQQPIEAQQIYHRNMSCWGAMSEDDPNLSYCRSLYSNMPEMWPPVSTPYELALEAYYSRRAAYFREVVKFHPYLSQAELKDEIEDYDMRHQDERVWEATAS